MRDYSFLPAPWARCFEHWAQSIEDRSGSADSREVYTSIIVRFLRFIDKDPGLATRADVASWLAQPGTSRRSPGKPISASCKNQRMSGITSFYTYASAYEVDGKPLYDRALPTVGMASLQREFQPRQMSEDEIARLFAALPDSPHGQRLRDLFYLYLILGRRKSELMRLRWMDIQPATINGQSSRIYKYIGKGNARLWHQKELPAEAYQVICDYLSREGRLETIQPTDFIFMNVKGIGNKKRKGDHLGADYIAYQFHVYAKKAGLPDYLSLHSLRWSSAFHRMESGSTLMEVRDALDHHSIQTTEHYLMGMKSAHDSGAAALQRKFSFLR
jgi:site-specific recombinase XerD